MENAGWNNKVHHGFVVCFVVTEWVGVAYRPINDNSLHPLFQCPKYGTVNFIISPYSVAFGVILSLLLFLFVCTVEDISTQDGAIGVKFLAQGRTPGTGTR